MFKVHKLTTLNTSMLCPGADDNEFVHFSFINTTNNKHSRSLQIAPFDRLHTSFYWPSTLTMALSCIISEIKRYIGRKSQFVIPQSTPTFDARPLREFPSECCHKVRCGKNQNGMATDGEKSLMFSRFDTIPACDGRTDRQTSCQRVVRTMHTHRAVKIES